MSLKAALRLFAASFVFWVIIIFVVDVGVHMYRQHKAVTADAPVARLCTTEKINPWHFDEPLWEYCDHVPMKSNI